MISDRDIVELLENLISTREIRGFVDEERQEFVQMDAYKQTTYSIVTKFDLTSRKIECPHCGAPNSHLEKSSRAKCEHCGSIYIVPDKIQDRL